MYKKRNVVIILVVATFILATGLISFALFKKNSSSLDFQAYAPQILPPGLRITDRTVDIWSNKTNPFVSKKILTYRLDESKGYISQADKSGYTSKVVMCGRNLINQTCKTLKTPEGQQYIVELTSKNNQELSSQTIRWFKNDTYIWLSLNSNVKALSENDINQTVDSFNPATYDNLRTKHYTPGP